MKPILPVTLIALHFLPGLSRADTIFSWETDLQGWAPADGAALVTSPTGATDGTKSMAVTTPMSAMWYSTPASINLDGPTRQTLFTGATELTLDLTYPDPGYTSWTSVPTVELIVQGAGLPWTTLGVRDVSVGAAPQTFTWPLTVGQAATLAGASWAQVVMKFTYGNGGSSSANAVFYVDKLGSTIFVEPPVESNYFWKGSVSESWTGLNWTTDAAGTTAAAALTTNGTAGVAFSAEGADNFSTVLGANQNVKSVVFSATSGAIEIGGTHNLTIGEDGIQMESGGGPVTIHTTGQVILGAGQKWANHSGGMLTVDSVISGSGGLTTGGTGVTLLNAANTHTAGTTVEQGTLVVGHVRALGPVDASVNVVGGILDLNGLSPTIGGLAGTLGGSITNLTSEPSTLTLDDSSGSTFGAAINDSSSGTVSVVKKGSGSLTLGGAGSFTGSFLIQEGAVTANSALYGAPTTSNFGNAQIPDRTITVESAASVLFNTNNVLGNQQGNPSSLPTFRLNGSTLDATRYNLIGNVILNGGTLSQGSSDSGTYQGYQFKGQIDAIGTVPSSITSSNGKANHLSDETYFNVANVTGDADADLIVTAPLTNQSGDFGTLPGGLSKTGAGTLSLEGANTYSGPTRVQEGRLSLSSASLSDLAEVELSPGTILDLNFEGEDTVEAFVLNGLPQAEGTWGAVGSGAQHVSAQITGTGFLIVPGDAFAAWLTDYPSLSGPTAARDADPDHDGLSNLEEFAFNSNPTDDEISGKIRSRVQTVGADKALVVTLPVRNGAVLSGTAPVLLASEDMSYRIGGSNDLETLSQTIYEVIPALTADPEMPELDAGWTYRSFRLDGNVGGGNPRGPRGFLHVGVIDESN